MNTILEEINKKVDAGRAVAVEAAVQEATDAILAHMEDLGTEIFGKVPDPYVALSTVTIPTKARRVLSDVAYNYKDCVQKLIAILARDLAVERMRTWTALRAGSREAERRAMEKKLSTEEVEALQAETKAWREGTAKLAGYMHVVRATIEAMPESNERSALLHTFAVAGKIPFPEPRFKPLGTVEKILLGGMVAIGLLGGWAWPGRKENP